ncbi:MAG: T9SS type A sorting domain-containing protein, partial [Ferruginibacter sp.]
YFTDSLPSSFGGMTKLSSLNLFQNNLSGSIPTSINRLDSLKGMDISYNKYTFKDIAPFVSDYIALGKTYFLNYAPQNNIPIHRYNNKLAVSAGGTLSNDTFKWYKDSVLVATITGDSTYTPEETGRYYVAVTNSVATDLTLYADEFALNYIMPGSAVSATQNITGTSPVNITDGVFEIAKVQPTAGVNQLTGNVTALVNVDASVSTFHNQPYVQRHYDITPAVNANNAQATVTLYFTQNDFDNYNDYVTTNNLSIPLLSTGGVDNGNIHITQFHGNFAGSSKPENYSNPNVVLIVPTVAWDNANQWWIVTFPVTGFSGFFLGTANSVLPLTLLEFKGQLQNSNISLQWLTANEVSTKEFIIERSANGTTFNGIGNAEAQSKDGTNTYSFTDATPFSGNNFYRLKMVDKDGKSSFSNVIKINYEASISALEIYPNPASSLLNIKISSNKNENIVLKVTGASGRTIIKRSSSVNAGITQVPFNIEKLSSGLYYVSTQLNGQEKKITFLKK